MKTFKTLLLREWMQHQRGWWVLMALPVVLVALATAFGQVQMDLGDDGNAGPPGPLALAMMSVAGLGMATLALAWLASMLQSPGLARRDVQDRSIEFWLSLPISHAQALAAPLLMHLLLVPMLALAAGLVGGLLVSVLLVAKAFGFMAWLALPWADLLVVFAALALRLALGLLLATLWLSPLILGTMAASAWLKRWGVPVVAGVTVVSGLVLQHGYGNPVVWNLLQGMSTQASQAFFAASRGAGTSQLTVESDADFTGLLQAAPAWLLHDAGLALAALATPGFLGAIAVGATGLAAMWWRRQRGS